MLEKIKSVYREKAVISLINEKRKLSIIKYNKGLQTKMSVSLINYKILSGKYVVFGENGKGKEYYNDGKLIFEGEYLNGKRSGKGKEYYYDGTLIFEGEYLNGKEWNGKKYNINNEIIYEIKNGKGLIKEYDHGKLIFEGEYLNGEKNGKGREYYNNGKLYFEGEYLKGKKWKGKIYSINGKEEFKIRGRIFI